MSAVLKKPASLPTRLPRPGLLNVARRQRKTITHVPWTHQDGKPEEILCILRGLAWRRLHRTPSDFGALSRGPLKIFSSPLYPTGEPRSMDSLTDAMLCRVLQS